MSSTIPQQRWNLIQQAFRAKNWPIYFVGKAGRGKSVCAARVFQEWPETVIREFPTREVILPRFYEVWQLIQRYISQQFDRRLESLQREIQYAPLVVLDDVADRGANEARRSALLDIIRWREGLPLLMTGNFDTTELTAKLGDDRLSSRIARGTTLKFGGPDLRMKSAESIEV